MEKAIPVVFCFDANFVNYAAVATFSAFSNSKTPIKFYWVVPYEDVKRINSIKELLKKRGADINIEPILDHHFSQWKEAGQVKRASYIRLLIPETIPEQKAIYLDCDIIVQADLKLLFNTDLNNNSIGGAYDLYGDKNSAVPRSATDTYINAGVLILDLKKLREDAFFRKCIEIYNIHSEQITFCDQCIINKYAENFKTLIDSHWNFFVVASDRPKKRSEILKIKAAAILHFPGEVKPWDVKCHPCVANIWWKYAILLCLPDLKRARFGYLKNYLKKKLLRLMQSLDKRFRKTKKAV